MKVEYINAFIKASTGVLNSFINKPFKFGKPFVRNNPYPSGDVAIVLGITGDIRGQAILSLSEDLAIKIASGMMMGMDVTELDEMAKSALSELGNMIMGNASTILSSGGTLTDITPPTLFKGKSIEITSSGMETICVPLVSEIGTIEFDISIKK